MSTMSGRASKWIMFVLLPLLLALYLSYPPIGVEVARYRVETKTARTAEDAAAHAVRVGDQYSTEMKVSGGWLPLVFGKRDESMHLLEEREDGTIVAEKSVRVQGRVKLGLDIAGGTELLYQLDPREGERIGSSLANTISILKKRIDPNNVKEFRIQAVKQDRILIQVPQATSTEVEQLKRRLEQMGKLEFKLCPPHDPQHERLYSEAAEGRVPPGYVKTHVDSDPAKEFFLVKEGDAEITGRYLSRVYPTVDQLGLPAVGFEFGAVGARRFAQITETNRKWYLAIILDGVLKSAPEIEERIAGRGIIRGSFTQQEVSDMVNVLQAGSLPMDIQLLQESTVGPQLGRDSIRRGLLSLAVAGLLVLGFIGLYYMTCGLVADGALLLNLVFLVGALSFMGAALTLPGMAGILLTVGMAVDANVLIFERIREESAAGKGIRVALRNGYDRAFATIVDANVTTLLTAIILYLVGTGPVKGFAITLSLGILLSMFTALVVTRLVFETMVEGGKLTEFRMRSLISRPSIVFSGIRKPAYLISLGVVVVGMVAFLARGGRLYDIDFTGGTLVQIHLSEPTSVAQVRSLLAEGGFTDAEVQGIQSAGATQEGLTDFAVRVKGAGAERVKKTIRPAVVERLAAAQIATKKDSPTVAPDGSALELQLQAPISEMDLRRALAEGDDVYSLGRVGTVVASADTVATEFVVQPYNVSSLVEPRDLWGTMLRSLAWAGLQRQDYEIQECAIQQGQEGAQPVLRLVLDKPIQWQLLATELDRREFPQIEVEVAGDEGTAFLLRASRQVLEQFRKELPAGSALPSVPMARVDGNAITASLEKEFSEQDLRALFEKQGLTDVYVAPLNVASDTYRLNLSYEPVREKLEGIFAGRAARSVDVTFQERAAGEDDDPESVAVDMVLDTPMTLDVIMNYIDLAGLGPYAEGIVSGSEKYAAGLRTARLTLNLPAGKASEIQERIRASFGEPRPVQRIVSIGATVAKEMQGRALLAVLFASVIIVLYVAARFHAFRFGVAAVIALVHDILITAGLIALADWSGVMGDVKINLAMLAAFLTILGYSLNDTIVVFDRIRENMVSLGRKYVDAELIDLSINQTLSRTILTSLTTLAVVLVLYLMGGSVLQGLALTLIIGVVVGTYSSMFIASPVLLDWAPFTHGVGTFFRILSLPVRLPFKAIGALMGSGK